MRVVQAVMVAAAFAPASFGEAIRLQRGFESAHRVLALGRVSWRELNHVRATLREKRHEIDFNLRLNVIFATLAREHDHNRMSPPLMHNRIDNRLSHLKLITAQNRFSHILRKDGYLAQSLDKKRFFLACFGEARLFRI